MKLYELVDTYKASRNFIELAPNSQVSYQQMIDAVYASGYRTLDVETVSPATVDYWFPAFVTKYGRSKAIQMTKVMKRIWNYGYRAELIKQNPWAKMGIKGEKPRTAVWSPELVQLVKRNAPTEFAVFFRLLYMTGQRPVDILNTDYSWGISSDWEPTLTIEQKKTGKTVVIPIPKAFAANLRLMRGFSSEFKRNYLNIWASLKAKLNDRRLDDLQLRDLRRTVLTEMATGGATDVQIRAVSGHSRQSSVPEQVYIQRQEGQAREGLNKRVKPIKEDNVD